MKHIKFCIDIESTFYFVSDCPFPLNLKRLHNMSPLTICVERKNQTRENRDWIYPTIASE